MATEPRHGFARGPGHVEDAFADALSTPKRLRRAYRAPDTVPPATPIRSRGPWKPRKRPRTSWGFWRGVALRLLGVPYPLQNVLLDHSRWSVTVTRHAIEQAGERFREGNPAVIAAEVADAITHARVRRRAPSRSRGSWGNARHAWTENGEKVYVVRRAHRAWVVITALPPEYPEPQVM